jgi:hypothetical protein
MVNILQRFRWICAALLLCLSVHAASPVAYKIGDKAPDDIKAALPFDVVNAQGTADLKASKARGIAAIYHHWTGITNVIADQFLAAFAQAHMNFSNALVAAYHQPTIDNPTIESSDFGYVVTAFNVENKKFPISTELAVTWAHGDSGDALRDKWLNLLLQAMNPPVQADTLPPHFSIYGRKVRIMLVTNLNDNFTFQIAWRKGYLIYSNMLTITAARAKFRAEFSESDQPLAQALSQLLQPNCFPDVAMTQDARDYSVRSFQVSDHFDTGQVIVKRGDTIDANAIAALNAMNQALLPGALNQQITAAQHQVQQEQARAQQEHEQAQSEHSAAQLALQQQQEAQQDRDLAKTQAEQEREQATAMQAQAMDAQVLALKIRARNEWLVGALAAVSCVALMIFWLLLRRQRILALAPAKLQRIEKPAAAVPSELAPYLAETLKAAVVQGLAAQRAELLEAQRLAATEISELVHRLDQLQTPMQERLRAYQERIQELQKDLAERTEENRELLKLKIEMMRRQLENERGRARFN